MIFFIRVRKSIFGLLLLLILSGSMQTVLAVEPSPERQVALRHLLKNDCGACHGLTLQGGMGPALLPDNLNGKPDEFLVATILNGRKGTAMPPWQPFMNHDEALWLIGVLRKSVH
ncbi:c-type cytochrome [Methylobacter psychrophilus]|uniref:c-type cytochrome n=1 Tax=Methylobacter psychrophilus TaxID=96941 RepID=UPI002948BD51|nr:cytochrome c [Methylobacter psychrophilus]